MAQCKAKTAKGTRCTRNVAKGNKSYCKQHSKIKKKKATKIIKAAYNKKKKRNLTNAERRRRRRRKRKKKKLAKEKRDNTKLLKKLAEMAEIEGHPMAQILKVMQSGPQGMLSLMQMPQESGCGDPNCIGCGPPSKDLLGFAQNRDEKIIEMYETTNKPLWEIAKLAHVDESHVIRLCQSLGLDRGDREIGGPETWTPLFRPRYYPTHRRLRRYRRNPQRNPAPYYYF
jgi:hypothetical protein